MKLSTDAHSEIEGDAAHGNIMCNSASDPQATDAGNDESVATEGDDGEVPTPKDAGNSTPVRRLVKVNSGQSAVVAMAGEESEVENQQRQTPTPKQQRLTMVNREYYNGAIYPALCRPYAKLFAFCVRVCLCFCRETRSYQLAIGPEPQIHRLC